MVIRLKLHIHTAEKVAGVSQEPTSHPRLQEETWRRGGLMTDLLSTNHLQTCRKHSYSTPLTPSHSVSGTPVSSKTPGGDLEDWRSLWQALCQLIGFKLAGNIPKDVLTFLTPSLCSKEHPCPPRLQEETQRTVGVLTGIMSTNFLETYRKHS